MLHQFNLTIITVVPCKNILERMISVTESYPLYFYICCVTVTESFACETSNNADTTNLYAT